jgi:hypothetical protein
MMMPVFLVREAASEGQLYSGGAGEGERNEFLVPTCSFVRRFSSVFIIVTVLLL